MPKNRPSERKQFLDALALWDVPEEQLYGKVFDGDVDTDSFIDRAFSLPRAGVLKE
jgi:hypothetical protein